MTELAGKAGSLAEIVATLPWPAETD